MKYLLDTCTFLWLIRGDSSLSVLARDAILDTTNEVYLSVVSAWEIGVKFGLGKLPLPSTPVPLVARQRQRHQLESLPLVEGAALTASSLPLHHRDPFDRLLVGQALHDGLTILSPDALLKPYSVSVQW
ncbi:type II toxin-antitoxin system VapC family toxin [bacterium CPR1]|nr:type II toxin-antitoxin system VapC family toxin [bacterium CPR1]